MYRIIIENGVYNTGNFNVAINEHLSKYNVTKLPIYYRQFLSSSCFNDVFMVSNIFNNDFNTILWIFCSILHHVMQKILNMLYTKSHQSPIGPICNVECSNSQNKHKQLDKFALKN